MWENENEGYIPEVHLSLCFKKLVTGSVRYLQVHVLAMLDHPNIIGYYDSFEEDGIMMIEMEYADGG